MTDNKVLSTHTDVPKDTPFARWMTQMLDAREQSTVAAGRELGVTYNLIWMVKTGRRSPSIDLLNRLSYHWDVDFVDLMCLAGLAERDDSPTGPTMIVNSLMADMSEDEQYAVVEFAKDLLTGGTHV